MINETAIEFKAIGKVHSGKMCADDRFEKA
jgi:hypothetical protein